MSVQVTFEKLSASDNLNATLLMLSDSDETQNIIRNSAAVLGGQFTVWHVKIERTPASDLRAFASRLMDQIQANSLKRATLIALGNACQVSTVLLSLDSQIVRRAIFVDPPGRTSPGMLKRAQEFIQRILVVPLPFRADEEVLDLRPTYHRIGCPVVVVQSPDLDTEWSKQCTDLAKRIPSAWSQVLSAFSSAQANRPTQLTPEFIKLIEEFIEVPSKRSQKNLGAKTLPKTKTSPSSEQTSSPNLDQCSNG